MRAVYLFIFSLLFLLIGGDKYAHAHHKAAATYYPTQGLKKARQATLSSTSHNLTVIKNVGSDKDNEFLIDVEDDDESLVFAGKHVVLDRYFLTVSYAFILGYIYSSVKDRLPFYRYLSYTGSYIYLLQRSLRI